MAVNVWLNAGSQKDINATLGNLQRRKFSFVNHKTTIHSMKDIDISAIDCKGVTN